jgi:hypothetical protein
LVVPLQEYVAVINTLVWAAGSVIEASAGSVPLTMVTTVVLLEDHCTPLVISTVSPETNAVAVYSTVGVRLPVIVLLAGEIVKSDPFSTHTLAVAVWALKAWNEPVIVAAVGLRATPLSNPVVGPTLTDPLSSLDQVIWLVMSPVGLPWLSVPKACIWNVPSSGTVAFDGEITKLATVGFWKKPRQPAPKTATIRTVKASVNASLRPVNIENCLRQRNFSRTPRCSVPECMT